MLTSLLQSLAEIFLNVAKDTFTQEMFQPCAIYLHKYLYL